MIPFGMVVLLLHGKFRTTKLLACKKICNQSAIPACLLPDTQIRIPKEQVGVVPVAVNKQQTSEKGKEYATDWDMWKYI